MKTIIHFIVWLMGIGSFGLFIIQAVINSQEVWNKTKWRNL